MAEWSKAVDLSSILFVGVGSNPTSGIKNFFVWRLIAIRARTVTYGVDRI